ncbi:MAG: DUF488 domain-containing protein [Nitrososphaerales archaeon]
MNIKIKRVYDEPMEEDGIRILVDRIWPRGVSKSSARIDLWLKDIAPSHELRRWFNHDPNKWIEFRQRYFNELDSKRELVELIIAKCKGSGKNLTLLYGARDKEHNNAVVLKEYIDRLILYTF